MRTCSTCGDSFADDTRFCPKDQTALAAWVPQRTPLGALIGGRYRIVRKIGDGGMGAVYEAVHERLGRRFAIKLLHPEFSRTPEAVERFQREARAAATIGNEHIIDVTEFDVTEEGLFFIVMELLEGEELRTRLQKQSPLPIALVVDFAAQIAVALDAAHRRGIVHRDLKPENVFISRRDDGRLRLKVLDFGISKIHTADARLTRTGTIMGTAYYMAPEQARGESDIDARTDVWALGAMTYEMLTGHVPFTAPEATGVLVKIILDPVPPMRQWRPEVTDSLERVVLRALAKDRAERFNSCGELAQALRDAANEALSDETQPIDADSRAQVLAAAASASGAAGGASAKGTAAMGSQVGPAPVDPAIFETTARTPTPLVWQRSPTVLALPRKRTWIFVVGGVALAGAIAVIWMNRDLGRREVRPAVPNASSIVPATADTVEIQIASVPPGASVAIDDRESCTTPCSWRAPRSEREFTLSISLPGYATTSRKVAADRDRAMEVALLATGAAQPSTVGEPAAIGEPATKPTELLPAKPGEGTAAPGVSKKTSEKVPARQERGRRKPAGPRRPRGPEAAPNPFE